MNRLYCGSRCSRIISKEISIGGLHTGPITGEDTLDSIYREHGLESTNYPCTMIKIERACGTVIKATD